MFSKNSSEITGNSDKPGLWEEILAILNLIIAAYFLEWKKHLITECKPKIGKRCAVKLIAQILYKLTYILYMREWRHMTKLLPPWWTVSLPTVHVRLDKAFKSGVGPSTFEHSHRWCVERTGEVKTVMNCRFIVHELCLVSILPSKINFLLLKVSAKFWLLTE